jgi:hypothetical protein
MADPAAVLVAPGRSESLAHRSDGLIDIEGAESAAQAFMTALGLPWQERVGMADSPARMAKVDA